jgi:hypothetical protein
MANASEHKNKSIHNENFHNEVKKNLKNYVDWQITSLFYALTHLIEGYAKKHHPNEKIVDHKTRGIFVKNYLKLYISDYEIIRDESRQARYLDCTDCVNRKQKLDKVLFISYEKIKKAIFNLI